jgi:hypothetical protein
MPGRNALTLRPNDGSQGLQRPWLRRFLRRIAGVGGELALIAALATALALHVGAHEGGTMGIFLSAERLPPGGPLEIIGTDFAPGETLRFQLAGPTQTWMLPDVRTGADGHFAVVLVVPPDAGAGLYVLDAISRSGIIQRATFQVDPNAPAPALTPSPVQPAGQAPPGPFGDVGGWALAPLVGLAIVGVAFFVMVVRRRARAEPRAREASADGAPNRR